MKKLVNPEQLFISIMAGVTINYIQEALGIKKVVRAMPNLPAQVGKGLTSYVSAEEVSRLELFMVEGLLDTTGKSLRVKMKSSLMHPPGFPEVVRHTYSTLCKV